MTSSSSTTPTPSFTINEALVSINRTCLDAFEAVEKHNQQQIAALKQDLQNLQELRDAAEHEKAQSFLSIEKAEREASYWKATAEKADVTINHQTDMIAQARREAQEWKEQFIRVEEARCELSARVEELIAQQITMNRSPMIQEPLTPRSQYAKGQSASGSTRQSTASYDLPPEIPKSVPKNNGPPSYSKRSRDLHQRQRNDLPSKASSSARPKSVVTSRDFPSSQTPVTRLIRTVTAVVEVPIKEEVDDDDYIDPTPPAPMAASESSAEIAMLAKKGKGKAVASTRERQRRKPHVQNTPDRSDEYHEELDAKSHNSDEEDELMIGQEDDHGQLHGSTTFVRYSTRGTAGVSKTSSPEKRPLNADSDRISKRNRR